SALPQPDDDEQNWQGGRRYVVKRPDQVGLFHSAHYESGRPERRDEDNRRPKPGRFGRGCLLLLGRFGRLGHGRVRRHRSLLLNDFSPQMMANRLQELLIFVRTGSLSAAAWLRPADAKLAGPR